MAKTWQEYKKQHNWKKTRDPNPWAQYKTPSGKVTYGAPQGGSFLQHFAKDGRFGVAGGMLDAARRAGYTDKQIAVEITKGNHGLNIGNKIRAGQPMQQQMALTGKGRPGNWIHWYQNGSGLVGAEGLHRALNDGQTPEELMEAAGGALGGANYGKNWGVRGFGLQASNWLLDYMKGEPPEPMGPMEAEIPGIEGDDASHMVDNTAGYTAEGLNTPKPPGAELNTGGYGESFGRIEEPPAGSGPTPTPTASGGTYKKKTINPSMMINPVGL